MADEAPKARTPEELERAGLIAHSYDAFFSVRKRVRNINDITIPVRGGLSTNQIGVGVLVFFIQIVTYGLLLLPAMTLLGISPHPVVLLVWILGPAILVGQRIAKPMPHSKSIATTFTSKARRLLDDPIHRRGNPIPSPKQPYDMKVLHYQREWVMFDEYAQLIPGEADVTDPFTESGFARTEPVDLQTWYDDMAIAHRESMDQDRTSKDEVATKKVGSRRDRAAQVITPVRYDEVED